MANFDQKSSIHLLDIDFKNYTGSDIAAGIAVKIDTTAGNVDGVVQTTDDTLSIGITMEVIKAGAFGRVRVYGVAVATAGGTVTVGKPVMTDSAGKVVDQTAGKYQIGYALDGTTSANDQIRVLLSIAKNA